MGLLDAFRKKPKALEAFKIHPMARQAHPKTFSAWAAGGTVAGLNPETDLFEEMDFPIFDPSVQYIVLVPPRNGTIYEIPAVLQPQLGTSLIPDTGYVGGGFTDAPLPEPTAQYIVPKRGEVWRANNGNKYLVIGNKKTLCHNYNPILDPDGMSLIVVRHDQGMKEALSHRAADGTRFDITMNLVDKVGLVSMEAIQADGTGGLKLYSRKKDSLSLRLDTFETKAV